MRATTTITRIIWNKTLCFSIDWCRCEVLSTLHLFSVSFLKCKVLLCSPCIRITHLRSLLWAVLTLFLGFFTAAWQCFYHTISAKCSRIANCIERVPKVKYCQWNVGKGLNLPILTDCLYFTIFPYSLWICIPFVYSIIYKSLSLRMFWLPFLCFGTAVKTELCQWTNSNIIDFSATNNTRKAKWIEWYSELKNRYQYWHTLFTRYHQLPFRALPTSDLWKHIEFQLYFILFPFNWMALP
jgi:hypothetical protein